MEINERLPKKDEGRRLQQTEIIDLRMGQGENLDDIDV